MNRKNITQDTSANSHKSNIILQASNLAKSYQEADINLTIFENISLQVGRGEMIAICGSSGSGKSTLLHLLGGLDQPTSGTVELMQQDIWSAAEYERCKLRNRHLGFVYQFHHLLPEFNALENVMMPLLIAGVKRSEAKAKAKDLLCKVQLEHRMRHRTGEMSGGERQRVAVARALVTDPDCVLADEPTGNLDQTTSLQIFDLMLSLNQSLNTSFIMVTHNRELADKMEQQWNLSDGSLIVS